MIKSEENLDFFQFLKAYGELNMYFGFIFSFFNYF